MKHKKKAQGSGAPAAVLIIIIAIFIILYILFLPPEERDKLLENDDGDADIDDRAEDNSEFVLDESPGTLFKESEREFRHRLPSVNLFVRKEDKTLRELPSVFVETSRSDSKTKTFPLFVEEGSENVQLSLTVEDHKGRLIVLLNDEEIFNGEVKGLFSPLKLQDLEKENVIELRASKTGTLNFFGSNFYDLRNVKVTGTIEDIDSRKSTSNFLVSQEEAGNMDSASILYFVECSVRDVGRLWVTLNDILISSGVPDCGSPVKSVIDPSDIVEGKNELTFRADAGTYLLDQISISTKLKKPVFPIYFFDINETQFALLENRTLEAELNILFVDDRERKSALLNINNRRSSFDIRDFNYTKDITRFMEDGNNFVRLEPRTTLNVVSITVELRKD